MQGVGFRPAVFKLACELGLSGFVFNDTSGVTIEVQGGGEKVSEFIEFLKSGAMPAAAKIISCEEDSVEVVSGEKGFVIRQSESSGEPVSQVTADMATCGQCRAELFDEKDFRFGYPFINCTNCGPRYSIIKTIPYDRPNTTMCGFAMCDKCRGQYVDPADRRFHAQPVACGDCGPKIWLADNQGKVILSESGLVITRAAEMLKEGKILAIKGIGGFHLAVDALNGKAVERLRQRKKRDAKPFAMMAASVDTIEKYAVVSEGAKNLLTSAAAPIVILPKKADSRIADCVAEGVDSYGFMLCYAPLHHLFFAEGLEAIVMTSGNISDEPLICKNDEAIERLGAVADAFVMHDREIYRQVDDSVVHFIGGAAAVLRRARGYVPQPILSKLSSEVDILACGADMKNTFCFVKGNQLICSEHIGDLEEASVYHHYLSSIEHLAGLFNVKPKAVVCDLHPGYFSSRYAKSIGGVEVIEVQHHWAHIASVLAEHGKTDKVIGIVCDGTGFGTDGNIWGCECMIASLEGFERFGHLAYFPLAGGDKASKEAIRPTIGLLKKAYADKFSIEEFSWLLDRIEPDRTKQRIISEQIDKNVNTAETSSLGRVFDAAAAMAGIGGRNDFEAQLPMGLEAQIAANCREEYDFEIICNAGEPIQLDLSKMITQIVSDVKQGVDKSIIAAKFHNGIAAGLAAMAMEARRKTGLNTAVISGGVFCNRYLADRLIKLLNNSNFCVLFNAAVPSNDGGVALGQAAIAACKMAKDRKKFRQD